MSRSVLGATAMLALLLLTSCFANQGKFLLVNKAKEEIVRASVVVSGQTIELKNIPPNNSAAGSYSVKSDSHYEIQIEFESGKKLKQEIGYVTHGMDFQHEITITDSDMQITDSKIN